MQKTLVDALDIPDEVDAKVDIWLEQQIWGHRFYNDQTPWLLLLEALGVMSSRNRDKNCDRIFPGPGDKHETMSYSMLPRRLLRQILFCDRHIDEIADRQAASDATMWNTWFERLGPDKDRFVHLRDRFTKFGSFRNAVALLRSCEIEPERHRRPTSRHLAPRGQAMLSADYGEGSKGESVNKDRRFFSRGGELLYLMLNRSGLTDELEGLVDARLLSSGSRWDKLAQVLEPVDEATKGVTFENIGYLPPPSHPCYRTLAEDWVRLLSLKALPDDNLPEPLMRLSGLAVVRFIIDRAAETLGIDRQPIPVDMVNSETVGVQKLSKDAFARHRDMTRKAIEKVVDDLVASDDWQGAVRQQNPTAAAIKLSRERFGFPSDKDSGGLKYETLAQAIKKEALDNHEMHLGRVIGFYAEQIGLAVARKGSGRWYATSDGLLEALVLANVTTPMEFETFLETLFDRYGMIIGSEVGQRAYKSVNYEHLKANQKCLEERLRVLGLLKRLSDDCAFVVNPFWI